jgi:beta-N-acetylhexosaminidase
MLLVCNNPSAAEQVLEDLPITDNPLRDQRLERMQGNSHITREQLLNSEKWRFYNNFFKQLSDLNA